MYLVKNFPAFMEPEIPRPYPTEAATSPYSKLNPSGPHYGTNYLMITINIIPQLMSYCLRWLLSIRVPHQLAVLKFIVTRTCYMYFQLYLS
jgi:hypothetical protein